MKKIIFLLLLLLPGGNAAARQMYVVTVGIANYLYINDLTKCEKDATDFGKLLRTHTPEVYALTGAKATRNKIISTLGQVFGKAQEDDVVVFFFSGHGNKTGLVTYETGGSRRNPPLTYGDLQNVLKRCQAKTKLLFIDACYSGSAREDGHSEPSPEWNNMAEENKVMLFLSSRTGETSLENPRDSNGMFTKHLLRALKGGADADNDRIVTAQELFAFVSKRVRSESSNRQHPVMWGKFEDNLCVINWNKR